MADQTLETRELTVLNKLGLHARPASIFVKKACEFSSKIMLDKDGQVSDGKSIIGVLMLAASQGSCIKITAEGEDAVDALDALEQLITDKFGEE